MGSWTAGRIVHRDESRVGVGISRQLLVEGATVVGCSRAASGAAAAGMSGGGERSAQWVCDRATTARSTVRARVVDTYAGSTSS